MTICIDPFKNINIVNLQKQVSISPCCLTVTKHIDQFDFQDDQYLQQVRQGWLTGKFPSECRSCKQIEDIGGESRRQGSNKWYTEHNLNNTDIELVRMDYWTGDTCNLACVICGPHNSSVWKQELGLPIELQKSTANQFWKTIDLSKIQFIHFNGGEPLLSKEHVKLLHAIEHKDQVHLNYNTNGTILPNEKLLNLWEQFKLVQLDFSIDDIGERFEYQRYPAVWSEVEKNLQWFINNAPHNCMFAVNITVSILNQNSQDELIQWLRTHFSVTRFTDPIEIRQQLANGLLSIQNPQRISTHIISYLDKIDNRRGTSWRRTFPLLEEYVTKPVKNT